MINTLRLKLILKSLKKQNLKFKILLIQFVIIFLALNIASSFLIKAYLFKKELSEITCLDNTVIMKINASNDENVLSNLKQNFEKVKSNDCIEKMGMYYLDNELTNNKEANFIFITEDLMDIYKFNILGSSDIFKSSDVLKVLVSEDLKNKYKINDKIELKFNKNIDALVTGYISKNNNFWTNEISNDKSIDKIKNSLIIPFGKNYFYDKNIEYRMYNNVSAKLTKNSSMESLSELIKSNTIENVTSMNELIKKIKDENKQVVFLLLCLTILLAILQLIGFVGGLISYISLKKKEYAIRYVLGSTLKELNRLVCGEFGIAIIISFLTASIIDFFITIILKLNDIYILILSTIPSLIFVLIIFLIFFFINTVFLKKKNTNCLMRGK